MTSVDPEGGTLNRDEPQSMAALLDEEATPHTDLRRGDIVEGAVVGTDRDGVLVDIGAKSEGVIPANEMLSLQPEGPSRLNIGEKVLVFVIQPESAEGQVILSLDRARGEQGWRILQDYMEQEQAFEGYVTGSNKGGLLVNVEGVNAFVPLSQIASGRPERGSPEHTERQLSEWVGRTLTLKVIELNRRRNRAIVSERAAVQEKRAAQKERLLQELQEGDIRIGRITSIRDFGLFVDVGGADGLVHLSELSWERTPKSPADMFNVGDEVEVYVLKVDQESKKIALSLRRAQPERWEEIVSRFREGQIVPGQVTKLAPFGAFVRLEGPIEGLIHISELVDRRINHPNEIVDEGDVVPVKIVRIEHDRHRLGLSLRQARGKAEEDGWIFDDNGGVTWGPEEEYDRLGLEAPPKPEVQAKPEPQEEAEAEAEAERKPEPRPMGAMEAALKAADAEAIVDKREAPAVEEAKPEEGREAPEEAPQAEEPTVEPETAEPEAAEETAQPEAAEEEEAAGPEAAEETAQPEATEEEEAAQPEAAEETAQPEAAEEEEATEPEVAEEEPQSETESEEEEETTVTEDRSGALNKEEGRTPQAESEPDEASEAEEKETSG